MAPTAVAQPPRPPKPSKTRYFKGKAPELARSDSESEDDDEAQRPAKPVQKRDENIVAGGAGRLITNKDVRKGLGKDGGVKMSLGDVKIGGNAVKREAEEEESEEESEEEDEEETDVKPAYIPRPPGDEVCLRSAVAAVFWLQLTSSRASTRRIRRKNRKKKRNPSLDLSL